MASRPDSGLGCQVKDLQNVLSYLFEDSQDDFDVMLAEVAALPQPAVPLHIDPLPSEYGTYKTVKSQPDTGLGFQVKAL